MTKIKNYFFTRKYTLYDTSQNPYVVEYCMQFSPFYTWSIFDWNLDGPQRQGGVNTVVIQR